jgi:hypothetical protein
MLFRLDLRYKQKDRKTCNKQNIPIRKVKQITIIRYTPNCIKSTRNVGLTIASAAITAGLHLLLLWLLVGMAIGGGSAPAASGAAASPRRLVLCLWLIHRSCWLIHWRWLIHRSCWLVLQIRRLILRLRLVYRSRILLSRQGSDVAVTVL